MTTVWNLRPKIILQVFLLHMLLQQEVGVLVISPTTKDLTHTKHTQKHTQKHTRTRTRTHFYMHIHTHIYIYTHPRTLSKTYVCTLPPLSPTIFLSHRTFLSLYTSSFILGDLPRLQILEAMQRALLVSFDSAHRTPLFYAVAYNHATVTKYLLAAGSHLSVSKGEQRVVKRRNEVESSKEEK